MKKASKAGFLSPRSSEITVTKEKERKKRKSEEKERRRREKSNGCTLSFYNSYFVVFGRNKLFGLLGDNVIKTTVRYISSEKMEGVFIKTFRDS